jgi:phospholipase C
LLEFFQSYSIEAYAGFALERQKQIAQDTRQIAKLEEELSSEKDPAAVTQLEEKIRQARIHIASVQAELANSSEERYSQLTEAQRRIHDAAFVTNANDPHHHALESLVFTDNGREQSMEVPKGDIFFQFRKDVKEGKLPPISWLASPEKFSDHPTSPWYGAWYVSEVMDILTSNPEVWKTTIFILTYDENDGYFDHAPSFVAADPRRPETGGASAGIDTGIEYTYLEDERKQGVAEKDARSGPIGMGFRVPMIIASPWTRGGWVNSQLFDHTSTLMFLEHFVQYKYGKPVKEETSAPGAARSQGISHRPSVLLRRKAAPLITLIETSLSSAFKRPATRRSPQTTESSTPRRSRSSTAIKVSLRSLPIRSLGFALPVHCPTSYMRRECSTQMAANSNCA